MPLTPQEEQELQQLQAELTPATGGLTPSEQAELEQLQAEFSLPIQPTEIPQTPQFQMPKSALQQQLTPERARSAVIAGQLGGARTLTELTDILPGTADIEQQLMQEQIKAGQKPTPLKKGLQIVGETFEKIPIVGQELKKGLEFQPQTPAEQALELTSGLATIVPGRVPKVEDIAKVAKQRVQQFEAIDSIATKVRGLTAIPPEFTAASDAIKSLAFNEVKAANLVKNKPGSKLKEFYDKIGFGADAEVFGAVDAKNAQDAISGKLERKIIKQEKELRTFEMLLQSKTLSKEDTKKTLGRFIEVNLKRNENSRILNKTLESPAFQALQKSQDYWGSQTIKTRTREIPVYKQSMSKQGVYLPPSEIEELTKQRNITINPLQRLTMDQPRIMQVMDGNVPNGPMFELNIRPALNAERAAINATNAERNAFNQVALDTGVTNASKERLAELFRVADGKLNPAEVNITEKEQQFLNYMATKYNEWLTNINLTRSKLGYTPIKVRQNYITHLQEAKLFDNFGLKNVALEGDKRWGPKLRERFRFEKQRLTDKAIEDPIQAFDAYIEPAMRQIHTTEPAAILHARARLINDPVLKKMQQNFIETRLLGGLDAKDRTLYEYGLGPVMQLSENLTGRFSGGVILGNAKVILQQFSQVANTIKDAGLRNSLIGLGRAVKEIPPEIASRSDFLTSRRINDDLIDIPKGLFYKPNKFLRKLFEYTDKFVAKQSWNAGFAKAQEAGLDTEAAIRYADDVGRQLHGSYSKLYKTELNSGKVGKILAPLQSFGFNLWNYLVQDTKLLAELNNTSRARELMKTFAAMYVTDEVYEAAGLPSPFGIRIPKAATPEEVATSARELVFGVVPFGRSLEYGIPSPVLGQAVKEAQYFAGAGDKRQSMFFNTYALVSSLLSDDLEKRDQAAKDLAKFGVQFVPAGTQAYKTITGLQAAKDGYVEFGNQTVMLTPEDRRLAPILGPYAVPTIRKLREQKQVEKFRKQFEVK